MFEQLELPLFGPPTFEDILRKHDESRLSVRVNPRLKRSWHVLHRPFSRKRTLVVPQIFGEAPEEIKLALIEWASLPPRPPKSRVAAQKARKRLLERSVWNYVAAHHPAAASSRTVDPRSFETGTRGVRYDLREVFDAVNAAQFDSALQSALRWGAQASLTSYHSLRRSPDSTRYNLITIAGVYNHPDVPRLAIEAVMHHEMLHIAIPPTAGRSRRLVHGAAFRKAERAYEHHSRWEEWQRTSLRKLAVSQRRSNRKKRRRA